MSFQDISKSYGSAVDARMDAMQQQLDNMQLQLQAVLESLPPPSPPADETRPSASSGSPFPAQPPPPPGNPPQHCSGSPSPFAAQPPLPPVLAALSIKDAFRQSCCPHCRSRTNGTACPDNPLPQWSYATDWCQLHWGMTPNNNSLTGYFQDNQGVAVSTVLWTNQHQAIQDLLFFNGGVDRDITRGVMRNIEAGLRTNTLEVIWHRTTKAVHIVLGLRCKQCGFMFGAEWASPTKYPVVQTQVEGVQLALAFWLGLELPSSLTDGPQAQ